MTPNHTPCPDCGGAMLRRTNRASGQKFWGCARFPECRGTRDTDGVACLAAGLALQLMVGWWMMGFPNWWRIWRAGRKGRL